MASPQQLAAIEDWDNFTGVSTTGEKALGKTISKDIKASRADFALALSAAPKARATQLKHVFRSWKQRLGVSVKDATAPALLACFFDHAYERFSFTATSLKDKDAVLLQDIAPLAKAYGFELHLARPKYVQRGDLSWGYWYDGNAPYGVTFQPYGYNEDSDSDDGYGGYYGGDDSMREPVVDTNIVEMPEKLDAEHVDVCDNASALDGLPLNIDGEATYVDAHAARYESKPYDLNGAFVNGKITDGKRKARYMGEDGHGGALVHEYIRHALIITPTKSVDITVKVGFVRDFALEKLKTSASSAPTAKEKRLTGFLRHSLKYHDTELYKLDAWRRSNSEHEPNIAKLSQILRESAQRWKSVGLFVAICKDCPIERCVKSTSVDGLVAAYKAFSWAGLKDLYTDIITKTESYSLRGQLLGKLFLEATGRKDKACIAWCQAHCGSPLDAVQKLEPGESIDWVVDLSMLRSLDFFRDVLVPRFQVSNPKDLDLWSLVLKKLAGIPASTLPAKDRSLITRQCLQHLADNVDAYPTRDNPKAERARCYYAVEQELLDVKPVLALIRLGVDLSAPEACMNVLQRMWTGQEAQTQSGHAELAPHKYYSALVDELSTFSDEANVRKCLQPFFGQSVDVLAQYYPSCGSSFHTAIKLAGDAPKAIKRLLSPEHVDVPLDRHALTGLATFIFSSLRPDAKSSKAKAELDALLKLCVDGAIDKCRSDAGGGAINVLELCYTVQLPSHVEKVLAKLLDQDDAYYTQSRLMPFLTQSLPYFMTKHELEMTTAPFAQFAAGVLKAFVKVLGPKPEEVVPLDQLKTIPCPGVCFDCGQHLRPFLANGYRTTSVRGKQALRTHLEKRLAKTKAWGFTWDTIKVGSPHTLQITKPQSIIALAQWAAKQTEGEDLLKVLGDEAAQRAILGADYAWVTGCISGTCSLTDAPLATTTRGEKRPSEAVTSSSKKARLSA